MKAYLILTKSICKLSVLQSNSLWTSRCYQFPQFLMAATSRSSIPAMWRTFFYPLKSDTSFTGCSTPLLLQDLLNNTLCIHLIHHLHDFVNLNYWPLQLSHLQTEEISSQDSCFRTLQLLFSLLTPASVHTSWDVETRLHIQSKI